MHKTYFVTLLIFYFHNIIVIENLLIFISYVPQSKNFLEINDIAIKSIIFILLLNTMMNDSYSLSVIIGGLSSGQSFKFFWNFPLEQKSARDVCFPSYSFCSKNSPNLSILTKFSHLIESVLCNINSLLPCPFRS